jgi:hypothetical protein
MSAKDTSDDLKPEHVLQLALRCATTPGKFDEDVRLIIRAADGDLQLRAAMKAADSRCRDHPGDRALHAAFVLILGALAANDAPRISKS